MERTTQPNEQIILATAYPSKRYHWWRNFNGVTLEARLVGGRVQFYEVCNGQSRQISEDIVRDLFPVGCRIKDQPFLKKQNEDFYAVLNRYRKKYHETFNQIKNKK